MPGGSWLGGNAQNALSLFNAIWGAARQGLDSAEIWQTLRDLTGTLKGEALLPDVGTISGADISILRGAAGAYVRAEQAFLQAAETDSITAAMIAQAPWAMTPQWDKAVQSYIATFEVQYEENGQMVTSWRTFGLGNELPATKGELLSDIELGLETGTIGTPGRELSLTGSAVIQAA